MVYRILCSGFWAKRIHLGLEQQEELVFALDTPILPRGEDVLMAKDSLSALCIDKH